MAKGRLGTGSIDISADFSGVTEALAAGRALSIGMKDQRYLDAIVDVAFGIADNAFNTEAAAYAMSTGDISHMYEWGTAGINKGRTNRHPNPMSESARLWENFAVGHGLNRTLEFIYKPSMAYVPLPTKEATGMDPAVISRMRKHVFKWKAEVMEEGNQVEISPKKGKFLLIPAYEQNRPFMRKSDVKRGYALSKGPIITSPGTQRYSGYFTEFWYQFWEGRGGELVDKSIEEQMLGDFTPTFVAANAAKGLKPLYKTSIQGQVQKRSQKILNEMIMKANARRAKEGMKNGI